MRKFLSILRTHTQKRELKRALTTRMAPLTTEGSLRATTRAKSAADTFVKDADTAMEYLIDGDFKSEDDELSFEFLSVIAMQLSQQSRLSTKQASDGFKALSYLIDDLHRKRTVEVITDVIAKAVSLATKRVRDELEAATEQLEAAVVTSTNTVEELKEDCRTVVTELRDAVEEVTTSLENVGSGQRREAQDGDGGSKSTNSDSYADRTRRTIPAVHAMAVAKAELQKRKIRLIKATGQDGDGMGEMTEKQWVEKANAALGSLVGHEDNKPAEVLFVGVSKEREGRGVIFEMNSGEAAVWLKDKRVMEEFLAKMGPAVDFKVQTFEVVIDWVPVSFDAEEPAAWKRVEQSNGLRESAIRGAAWIKPTHLRTDGQQTAIAILRLATREDANQVIENGIFIEGKKVWGRKQIQEPKRCLKCQCFGEHKAAQCASIHDVCGRCGQQHRTGLCAENGRDKWECSNCKAVSNGKHRGHGAADRRCPIFLMRVDRMNRTWQENKYKFFCTSDPATWELHEHGRVEEQIVTDSRGQVQRGGTQRTGEARGRLGGGKKGEGGGNVQKPGAKEGGNTQKSADKRKEGARAETRADASGSHINDSTEAPGNGNSFGVRGGGNYYGGDTEEHQDHGSRMYRPDIQRPPGLSQTTLNAMWKGKEKETRQWADEPITARDLRSWSEDLEQRLQGLERGRHYSTSPYV